MKIKNLKIRNIASIEKADIDFENDLRDNIEGTPAPLFLITGDTGAGKSVILDAISMALYGTTPRVQGVANRARNSFLSSDGNEIKINDIAQYTRLGISSKEECFVELSFEGNDQLDYTSKFSLGINRNGKLRPSAWRLQIGNKEVIEGNKKDEIKERIRNAVGLNYDQFCRMAMLAQGQFASFLTGGKEERERILEQLTSTQHFSRYGEAIERIFKKAKQRRDVAENTVKAEKVHLLSPELEREETVKLVELEKLASDMKKEKEMAESVISLLKSIEIREEEKRKIDAELHILRAKEGGNDFKLKKDIINKWDASQEERALLTKRNEAKVALERSWENFMSSHSYLNLLSDNLDSLRISLDKKEGKLKKIASELIEYEPHKSIYTNLPLIREKISQLGSYRNDLKNKSDELERSKELSNSLITKLTEASAAAKEAERELKKEREELDRLQEELAKLEPEKITRKLENTSDRLHRLEKISSDINSAKEQSENILSSLIKRDELASEAALKREAADKARMRADEVRTLYEEAVKRYDTMHYSVEEGCDNLRHRLIHQKAHTCPLCGQEKEWGEEKIDFKEVFSSILSPLEEEREKLKIESDNENTRYQTESKSYNEATGMLRSHEQMLSSLRLQFEKAIGELIKSLNDEGIKLPNREETFPFAAVSDKVNYSIANLTYELKQLTKQKESATNLQKIINNKIAECRPLEKKAGELEKTRAEAHTKVEVNTETITHLQQIILSLKPKIKETGEEINSIVSSLTPNWTSDPAQALSTISKQAEEYATLFDRQKDLKDEITSDQKWLDSIRAIKADIEQAINSLPDIPLFPHPDREESDAIRINSLSKNEIAGEWRNMLGSFTSEIRNIITRRKEIREADQVLNEYYREAATTEEELSALTKLAISLPQIRASVEELNKNLASHEEALKVTVNAIASMKKQLEERKGTDKIEQLPELEKQRAAIDIRLDETLRSIGIVKERLDRNNQIQLKMASALQELEKEQNNFAKWDLLNRHFGGTRLRTLVQSYILRPLLRNANIYLRRITDRFTLTCSDSNEQLSILVLDRYNKNKIRSTTVLSGGEKFMVSLALSLALSAMNKPGLNVDILFIDEGFGTLDSGSLNAVIDTLRRLPEIAGSSGRRVGVISHREELADCIETQIRVKKCGEGRSRVEIS